MPITQQDVAAACEAARGEYDVVFRPPMEVALDFQDYIPWPDGTDMSNVMKLDTGQLAIWIQIWQEQQ